MYGTTQESGLTEILPLMRTSALWGQHPVLLTSSDLGGVPYGVAEGWMGLTVGSPLAPS